MKKRSIVLRLAAFVMAVLMTASVLSGCDFGVFSNADLDNPKQTVLDFINTMKTSKFDQTAADTALGYIGNYSNMGFEKFTMVEDDNIESELFFALRKSYSVEFADDSLDPVRSPYTGEDMSISGKQAFVTFEFTSLDFTLMSDALAEQVNKVGSERMYSGEVYETQEQAMALVEEVYASFAEEIDIAEFCTTKTIQLEMLYTEEGWKLMVNDVFYDALLGK